MHPRKYIRLTLSRTKEHGGPTRSTLLSGLCMKPENYTFCAGPDEPQTLRREKIISYEQYRRAVGRGPVMTT